MKRIISVAAMLLISSSIAFAQTASDTSASNSDEKAIHQVENEIVAALDHNDASTLDRL